MTVREMVETADYIHRRAVAGGVWDGKNGIEKMWGLIAMVHCEWSAAMESVLEGNPMVWENYGRLDGTAVKLVSGCNMLLDILSMIRRGNDYREAEGRIERTVEKMFDPERFTLFPITWLVVMLHRRTDQLVKDWGSDDFDPKWYGEKLLGIVRLVDVWLARNGHNMRALAEAKNVYEEA